MRASLSSKVGVSVFFSIVVAVGLVAMLTYLKAQDSLARMVESRNAFVAGAVKTRLELGLGLGLELESLSNTQDVINAAVAADPNIVAIEVFSSSGRVIFGSGPEAHRPSVPASWQRLLAGDSSGESWSIRDSSALVTGVPLTNSFDQTVGGLAISYSRQSFDATSRSMLIDIIIGCIRVLALALVVAMLSVLAVFRPIGRSFERTIKALSGFRAAPTAPTTEAVPTGGLDLAVARFRDRASAARTRIVQAERQLDNLNA